MAKRQVERTWKLAAIILIAGLAIPFAAQAKRNYTVDPKTGKKLLAAQEMLQAEQYGDADKVLASFRIDRLNAYEAAVVYQLRGYAAASQEKYADAAKYFDLALKQEALPESGQSQTRFTLAQLQLMLEQWDAAIANFEKWFTEVEAPNPNAYYMLAVAYYQAGLPAKALVPAKRAVAEAAEPKERWLQLLFALLSGEKNYQEGLPVLEQLVTRFPNKTYWSQLAAVYAVLGKDDESLAAQQLSYTQGLLTTDRELRRLAQMYLYNDLPYRAAKVMQQGLADGIIERDSESYKLLGDSWLAARNYDLALEPLTKAAALSTDGELYMRLGQVYVQREAWPEALLALEKAVAKGGLDDPGNAHLLIGIARYNQKQLGAARSAFARAKNEAKWEEAATRWLDYITREEARSS